MNDQPTIEVVPKKSYLGILITILFGVIVVGVIFYLYSIHNNTESEVQLNTKVNSLSNNVSQKSSLNESNFSLDDKNCFINNSQKGGVNYWTGYCIKNNQIIWNSREFLSDDVANFQIIPESNGIFAKDSKKIYLKGKVVEEADLASFKFLYHVFAKDKNNVYQVIQNDLDPNNPTNLSEVYKILSGVNALSFEFIDNDYFKDNKGIYKFIRDYENPAIGNKLISLPRDLSSFKTINFNDNDEHYYKYSKDKTGVYINDMIIEGADPSTFEILKDGLDPSFIGEQEYLYSKDSKYVFYKGKMLRDADPSTFTVINTGGFYHEYGKDKNNVFYEYEKIPLAQPLSFKALHYQVWEGCGNDLYALDSLRVFYATSTILGADPNTFETQGQYAKDKSHVYLKGKIQPELDATNFVEECRYGDV